MVVGIVVVVEGSTVEGLVVAVVGGLVVVGSEVVVGASVVVVGAAITIVGLVGNFVARLRSISSLNRR